MIVYVLIAVIVLAVAVAAVKKLRSRSVANDDMQEASPVRNITEERRKLLFTTTDTLPSSCEIVRMFGIVQVEIWHQVDDQKDRPYQRALDQLAAWSPWRLTTVVHTAEAGAEAQRTSFGHTSGRRFAFGQKKHRPPKPPTQGRIHSIAGTNVCARLFITHG